MLYSEIDRTQVTAELKKRRWLVILPSALMLLFAIASFVWFRLHRNADGWAWTALITVLSGSYFLFFYEVYLRPVSLYHKHIGYMLDGRKRDTLGLLKSIDPTVQDKDGLDCVSLTINVGERDNPEDDRLFYVDALKAIPEVPVGARVRVLSNDRMVASLDLAPKET